VSLSLVPSDRPRSILLHAILAHQRGYRVGILDVLYSGRDQPAKRRRTNVVVRYD
jgi:hypothetical protein